MKIGILTYHRAKNYGAFLQAYGLCSRLNEQEDITAEIIDFHMQKEVSAYKINPSVKYRVRNFFRVLFTKRLHKTFNESLKALPLSKEYCLSDNSEDLIKLIENKYDVVIVGSDEVWKTDGIRKFPNPYWLGGDIGAMKVSYAASSRSDLSSLKKEDKERIRKYLSDFSVISVRDEITKNQFVENIKLEEDILISPDPSFVYDYKPDKQNGRQLLYKKAGCKKNKKIALVMTENPAVAKEIYKEFKNDFELVSVFHYNFGYKNVADLTPFEWLDALSACDFVFTSYFHATCFSIINNVKFLSFGTKIKGSKLREILQKSGNMDRYVSLDDKDFSFALLKEKFEIANVDVSNSEFCSKCKAEFNEFLDRLYNAYNKECAKREISNG